MLLLEVDGLDGWYGRAQTLFGVSLNVQAGEAVVLLGRNGAGKSTTLKAIMGLEVERRGEIRFGGERIDKLPAHRIARLGLGYVPEDRRIFSGLTVDENLSVGRLPARFVQIVLKPPPAGKGAVRLRFRPSLELPMPRTTA